MSDKTEQPSLFSEPTDMNLSSVADLSPEGVARGAREYNPNLSKERSKAGNDQGHGLVELPQTDEVTERAIKKSVRRHPSGYSRPVPGESEGEITPDWYDANEPLDQAAIDLGTKHAAKGRAALMLVKNDR